eukprot:g11925.t1
METERHFRHLQQDATTRHIFPFPPLSAFRRDRSLRDLLVHTSATPNTSPQPYSTFPCNQQKWNTCAFTSSLPRIQEPKHTFQVKQHFTCTSKNLVYCIHCSQCGLLYIGEM